MHDIQAVKGLYCFDNLDEYNEGFPLAEVSNRLFLACAQHVKEALTVFNVLNYSAKVWW